MEAASYQPGEWKVVVPAHARSPVVMTHDNVPIATVDGDAEGILNRAILIAKAPTLRDSAAASLIVFRMIAQHSSGAVAVAAADMIPTLEAALHGLALDGAWSEMLNDGHV